jgi:uncharacterized protein
VWRVRTFSIAPVKSLGLHHPESIEIGPSGVPGDRAFYLIDGVGHLYTGADHGPLVRVRSAYDPQRDRLRLTFPDGSEVDADAAGGDAVTTDFFGRPVQGHVVDGPFADALTSYTGDRVTLVRVARPGDASDVHHVTLVSRTSVDELASRGGREGEDIDARRFRMLIEIDGTVSHEEDSWEGRSLAVGDVVLRMLAPVPRCVITTQDPSTGLKDFDTLKTIVRYRPLIEGDRGIPFGVYAEVERPGRARVGDEGALLD